MEQLIIVLSLPGIYFKRAGVSVLIGTRGLTAVGGHRLAGSCWWWVHRLSPRCTERKDHYSALDRARRSNLAGVGCSCEMKLF